MPLANIEKEFIKSLLQPPLDDTEFLSKLMPLHSLSEEKQLSIYRGNVSGAYQKVLAYIYPACFNVLGEDYFNQLCRFYRFEYPSTNTDLNNYGEYFPFFIEEWLLRHDELSGMEYLTELANLEWYWHASYYAKEDKIFSFEKLGLINVEAQDKIYFSAGSSFSLHSTIYPLLDIWSANRGAVESAQEFNMPDSKIYFCVNRVDFHPVIELLDDKQYMLLKSILDGLSLQQLLNMDELFAGCFENMMVSYIKKNWISGFFIKD